MAVLMGIDEAGYGPILGPLVVSAAAFSLPDERLATPLWELLPQSVSRSQRGSAGRILVDDSKKLHQGRGRYERLQRGVLAFLAAAGENGTSPENLGELLVQLEAEGVDALAEYPWYGSAAADWPLRYDRDDIRTAATALRRDCQNSNLKILALWGRPLPTGRYNQMVQAANNKATVLFALASQLIDQAYSKFGRSNLQIMIDQHGGRRHYRRLLQRAFPVLQMKVIAENDSISSYCLTDADRSMKIHFLEKGDQRQLPVALASMTSKYLRELYMEMLNAYFKRHCPDISPTAGYYKDGRRFLAELDGRIDANLVPCHLLVRER